MSKISDELRGLVNIVNCCGLKGQEWGDKFTSVADRIDREMVELPKSADGKIWTGREDCFWTGPADGDWHKFNNLAYIDDRWCVEDSDFERYPAVSVWYERPDSWERIADDIEAAEDWDDQDGDYGTGVSSVEERTLHEWAERIRKLAAKEDE